MEHADELKSTAQEKRYEALIALQDFVIRVSSDEKATPEQLEAMSRVAQSALSF